MKNRFEPYLMYEIKDGKLMNINSDNIHLADESFLLFKSLFDTHYGTIKEDENLISIHTGGWSENETLINEFKGTWWWNRYHDISSVGGHYYFNKSKFTGEKKWKITAVKN